MHNPRAVLSTLPIIEVLAALKAISYLNTATPQNEHQQRVNIFGYCILYEPSAVLWHVPLIEVLAAFIRNMVWVNATIRQASMEPPKFLVL